MAEDGLVLNETPNGKKQAGRSGCRKGCLFLFLAGVGALALLGIVGMGILSFVLGSDWDLRARSYPEDERPRLRERWSYGSGTTKAVRIPLEGLIIRERKSGLLVPQFDRVDAVLRQVRAAAADMAVRGILLEVESPGGSVSACDEIREEIHRFREDGRRKVVVWVRGLAASGAYYISTEADWIVAQPASLVGSIGVLLSALNWRELSAKIGVTDVTVKSSRYKDLLNPFREVRPEELQMLQAVVDSAHEMFVRRVAEGRKLELAEVAQIADGRIVTARSAQELGLVDEVGYWSLAVKRLKDLLGIERLKVIRYEGSSGLLQLLAAAAGHFPFSAAGITREPRLLFLWRP